MSSDNIYEISYLNCQLSAVTGEHITVGMFYRENDEVKLYAVSNYKMDLLMEILDESVHFIFKSVVDGYEKYDWDIAKLDWERRNQNGIVSISKPHRMALDVIAERDREAFIAEYWKRNIDNFFYKD